MDVAQSQRLIGQRVNREWLLTNDLGSFAMGTPERAPKRKYHGLLIARTPQFDDPHHVLADVAETLAFPGGECPLAVFQYIDAIAPRGHELIAGFNHDPEPVWTYACGDIRVERRLSLHPRRNAVRLTYQVAGAPRGTRFSLNPYFSCRNAHALQQENGVLDGRPVRKDDRILFRFYNGFPEIYVTPPQGAMFETNGFWNRRVVYFEEMARGYDFREDLFCPGGFHLFISGEAAFEIEIGLTGEGADTAFKRAPNADGGDLIARLERAAEAFLIQPGDSYASVIAGFPWFGEWGRDAFVSLPGLALARGDLDLAARMLGAYQARLRKGLAPNVLSKTPENSDLNSVDASLWYIRAVQRLEEAGGPDRVSRFEETVFEILESLRSRRHRCIHVRPSGLLYASSMPRPLTWMDAFFDGQAITPRSPFAVEVNALFYNAVRYALQLAERRRQPGFLEVWRPIAKSLKSVFNDIFWLPDQQYFADAHSGHEPDAAFRPNQLLALALPFRLATKEQGRAVLRKVRQRLLTPYGLRSLSPEDPRYRPVYVGDPLSRDLAYHQGAVWPWLLGPYIDAVLNIEGRAAAKRAISKILAPFEAHLDESCLGQISEIFDGDPPHAPRGAPAQAWSVAELLRIARLAQQK